MHMKTIKHRSRHSRSGFNLVELLVVIAIIAVLAVIITSVATRMRLGAAKAVSVSQMRNIGIGIASWVADRAAPEPFYKANGTGDYPHESSYHGDFRPGNPARVLYRKDDPSAGYLQTSDVFFSPLSKLKGAAPTIATYDPTTASEQRLWGTYTYHFPHVTSARITPRQQSLGVEVAAASGREADGKLMMSEFYRSDWCPAKFGKNVYHAMFSDWSIRHIADNDAAWTKWKNGN